MLWREALHACLDDLVSPARLEAIAQRLCVPPATSTVRINTLKMTPEQGLLELQRILSPDFTVRLDPNIPEMAHIQGGIAVTACRPEGLPVAVSPDCGKAVMRGAHVFVPGIVAMHSGARKLDKVSVYADLHGSLLKGAKLNARLQEEQNFLFIGNGILQCVFRTQMTFRTAKSFFHRAASPRAWPLR